MVKSGMRKGNDLSYRLDDEKKIALNKMDAMSE